MNRRSAPTPTGSSAGVAGEAPRLIGIALTLPALAALVLTTIYPIAWTLWLSVNGPDTAMTGQADLRGLDNYARIAASSAFHTALVQTLGLVAASFMLEAALGLGVALALHQALRGTAVFRAIVALPLMVAPVVGALAWRFIFADGYGMVDSAFEAVGLQGPLWFADIWLARASVVIANLWMALPFDILVLLAGLAGVPRDIVEAAQIDGASPRQILLQITLPLLKPVIAVILVVRLADAFRIFDVVYVLTGSGPANATDVLSTYIYRQMFTAFDFPGGAAASVLLVSITGAFSLLAVWSLRPARGPR